MEPTFKDGRHYARKQLFWFQKKILLANLNGVGFPLHVLKDTGAICHIFVALQLAISLMFCSVPLSHPGS